MKSKYLIITGIRGVPASHGGFETFAEYLSLYMVENGWDVTVYCQETIKRNIYESSWGGVNLVHIYAPGKGALSTILFDFKCVLHSLRKKGVILTLGYNTAFFNVIYRLFSKVNVINMDGIEWKRNKWGIVAKTWFWLNERIGCWVGNHLIADHPKIKEHLATRVKPSKITMIPYGGDLVSESDDRVLANYDLRPNEFSVIIARPEPENSFLEMVRAFSASKRNHKLVVLGSFSPHTNEYHRQVLAAASEEVIFPGAIYDKSIVGALRFYAKFYLHGHRVGGTNPSLVEALGAGCAIIAHDNHFNRWVARDAAAYFSNESECIKLFDKLLDDSFNSSEMMAASRYRFNECFTWDNILGKYEQLLAKWHPNN